MQFFNVALLFAVVAFASACSQAVSFRNSFNLANAIVHLKTKNYSPEPPPPLSPQP
jgi:hypothetical protein